MNAGERAVMEIAAIEFLFGKIDIRKGNAACIKTNNFFMRIDIFNDFISSRFFVFGVVITEKRFFYERAVACKRRERRVLASGRCAEIHHIHALSYAIESV